MATDQHILAVDVGSSSLKAVLFGPEAAIVAQHVVPYPTATPVEEGVEGAEQDCADWWRALAEAVRQVKATGAEPEALALTGSMQNLIAVDTAGEALAPALLYSDARVTTELRLAWQEDLPADFDRRTGNSPDNAQCVFKIRWCQTRRPDLVEGAAMLHFGAKDVLIHRLTGIAATDPTTAATTGLMDLAARGWDAGILAHLELDEARLPRIQPADTIVGGLTGEAASALGLPSGLPVVLGAGDAGAATWGAGAETHGRAYAYLGTTGWVAATLTLREAAPPRATYTLAAPVGDDVIVISPFLTAGSALEWVAARSGLSLEAALQAADSADAAPPDALFLPYLMGERAPFEDRDVRAAFLGLDQQNEAGALTYAAIEGIAHAVRHNLESLPVAWRGMTVTGGGAQGALQRQILADVIGLEVTASAEPRLATAYGAWRLAARALGISDATLCARHRCMRRSDRAERAEARYRAYLMASRLARDLAPLLRLPPVDRTAIDVA